MDRPNTLMPALAGSVERVLAALFRLLLRHGLSFTAFEAMAKRVYLQVALREFGIPGKKPSISRASILSGLTRKEVQRLLDEAEAHPTEALVQQRENRAVRVLSAWTRDTDFLDAQGQPLALPLQDQAISFAALVRRHSGDMPVRAVLDELMRVGAVQRLDDGRLALVQRAYLARDAAEKLEHVGTAVADMLRTIDHNIQHGERDPRFQRRVMYHHLPRAQVDEFRKFSSAQSMALLVRLDRWLAQHTPVDISAQDPPGVRLGIGIYYFEGDLDTSPPGEKGNPP